MTPHVRRRHPGWRQRGLRLRAARRPARPEGRAGREGQARRHLPAPRLHPDQGPAARSGGRRLRVARASSSVSGRRSRASTCRREQVQGRRGRPASTRACRAWSRAGRSPSSRASAGWSPDGRRGRRPALRGPHVVLATGSYAKSLPGLDIDGEPGHHQRPRAQARPRARLGGRARRRRHRLRVRQRLEVLRRRGHHRRGAAPPGPARGRAASKLLERAFRKRKIAFELGARFSGVETPRAA